MNYTNEFASVDLILNTNIETRGVDAFSLSLIKAEKQMRRIFTFLIFQNPDYNTNHYETLRTALSNNRLVYFEGFIGGINAILLRSLEDIYGENYNSDLSKINLCIGYRNKIFHGQITESGLNRGDLIERVNDIKRWCGHLGMKLNEEIGYDGFSKSYKKSSLNLKFKNLEQFNTIPQYKIFLRSHVERRNDKK